MLVHFPICLSPFGNSKFFSHSKIICRFLQVEYIYNPTKHSLKCKVYVQALKKATDNSIWVSKLKYRATNDKWFVYYNKIIVQVSVN